MNKKLSQLLSEKCKDMGLSDKAIDNLSALGCEGLSEEASDEELEAKADLLVPFAKEMQAEVTRKTKNAKSALKPSVPKTAERSESEVGESGGGAAPSWFKPFEDKLASLEKENAGLREEKAKAERAALIAAKAKELGIPAYLVKRVSFADDADIEKELGDFKQELVNNNLVPRERSYEVGGEAEQMLADAKLWAESLPGV